MVETRNVAENMVYQTEKQLSELGDKVPEDKKKPVEAAIADVKEVMGGDDLDAIKAKTEVLQTALQSIAELLYQDSGGAEGMDPAAAAAAAAAAAQGADTAADAAESDSSEPKQAKGKVVDADFEVVDDQK